MRTDVTAQEWYDELKSGKWVVKRHTLRGKGNAKCCLAVLADLILDGYKPQLGTVLYDNLRDDQGSMVALSNAGIATVWLGELESVLAQANDETETSGAPWGNDPEGVLRTIEEKLL